MPYISENQRQLYKSLDSCIQMVSIENPADLAYLTARLVRRYLINKLENWDELSNVIKALDSVIDEIRRRKLHPHEQGKMLTNGDVF